MPLQNGKHSLPVMLPDYVVAAVVASVSAWNKRNKIFIIRFTSKCNDEKNDVI